MQRSNTVRVAVAAGIAVFGLALQIGGAQGAGAAKVKPFVLTKVTPNPEILKVKTTPGTATKDVKVHWKGTAVFPLTLNVTPEPGCSTPNFTCYTSSTTYASGSHALVRTSTCDINGASPPGSFTGKFDYQLVDANGQTTAAFPETYTCTWP
jgi:hypothetical protein